MEVFSQAPPWTEQGVSSAGLQLLLQVLISLYIILVVGVKGGGQGREQIMSEINLNFGY